MSYEEKNSWAFGIIAVVTYGVYAVVILGRAQTMPLVDVPYVWTMLATIGAGIVGAIIVTIVIAITSPREAGKKDERDRQINRFGEYTGQSFVVIGGVGALLMAMAEWDYFWIANVIYLCFFLSAVLGTVTKIALYRRGLPSW